MGEDRAAVERSWAFSGTPMKCVVVALALLGCESENKRPEPPPRETPPPSEAKPDPRCLEKTQELAAFLTPLYRANASAEINMGWEPQVLDRDAAPIPQVVDAATITVRQIELYDGAESNRTGGEVRDDALDAKLRAMVTAKGEEPPDLLRLDVSRDATWAKVARVVSAAAKAGYTRAVFAFETIDRLVPPAGVEASTTSPEVLLRAHKRREELVASCPAWRLAIASFSPSKHATDYAQAVANVDADGIAACNCAVDIDEVKRVTWQIERWHQAHTRTGVEVMLGADVTIALPAATPWSDAHGKLVESERKAVTLAVK